MSGGALPTFTRRRIARMAASLLRAAGVDGVVPTPLEPVRRAAGVRAVVDIAALPADLRAARPPGWDRLLGAYWYEERTAFVDQAEPEPRRRFTDAHEAVHALCAWHGPTLRLDTADTLDGRVHDQIEAEANYGAAQLLFQGARFHREAAEAGPPSLRAVLALAERYGASRHAALHHYAGEHPGAVALLVTGRFPQRGGALPIWSSVESPAFLSRFGQLAGRLDGGLPIADLLDAPARAIRLPGRGFTAEAFYNRHCHFVLVAERPAWRRAAVRSGSCAARGTGSHS